jgi:hypothetical protein
VLGVIATIGCAALVTGCASIVVRGGRPLQTAGWQEALHVGTSTREEVMRVLGEPIGQGRALLPVDVGEDPRTVWTYYYEEATMEDARRLFLFVFLNGERYDGYLWFSSLPAPTASPRDNDNGGSNSSEEGAESEA